MSRTFGPGDAYSLPFTTRDATTKVLADADALPTAVLWRNGAAQAASGATLVTVTDLAGAGRYRLSVTIPAGWAAGDSVDVEVSATVDGFADSEFLDALILEMRADAVPDAVVAREEFQRAFATLNTHGGAQSQDGDRVVTEVLTAPNGGTLTRVTNPTRTEVTATWEDPEA